MLRIKNGRIWHADLFAGEERVNHKKVVGGVGRDRGPTPLTSPLALFFSLEERETAWYTNYLVNITPRRAVQRRSFVAGYEKYICIYISCVLLVYYCNTITTNITDK